MILADMLFNGAIKLRNVTFTQLQDETNFDMTGTYIGPKETYPSHNGLPPTEEMREEEQMTPSEKRMMTMSQINSQGSYAVTAYFTIISSQAEITNHE